MPVDADDPARPPRRAVLAAIVAAAALAAVGGVAWGRGDAGAAAAPAVPATSVSRPVPAPTATRARLLSSARWADVVARLEDDRIAALSAGDAAAVHGLYVAGAPARSADLRLVHLLHRRQWQVVGATVTVDDVAAVRRSGSVVEVFVVDRLSSYDVVDAAGSTVEHVPARPRRARLIVLRRVGGAWRIVSVAAAG